MVEVPAAKLNLVIQMRNRECGFYESTPPDGQGFGDSNEFATRAFQRTVVLSHFAIDITPVTNAEYYVFLEATHYRPKHPQNFLKHWVSGRPLAGAENHPVVNVDLGDARAFARWAGKRLPTEEEWQYAAQGSDGRKYPWGNEMQPNVATMVRAAGPLPSECFPGGRSPFGCYDLCGNVWQWTESERTDGRTRFCIIRGGSCFAARGSELVRGWRPAPGKLRHEIPPDVAWPRPVRHDRLPVRQRPELSSLKMQLPSFMPNETPSPLPRPTSQWPAIGVAT